MSSGVHEHLSVPLEGKLGDPATLPRLFAWLSRGAWSGTIHVASGDVERHVYFVEGRISSAASNDPADALAAHLRSLGLVRSEDLDMALAALGPGDKTAALARQLLRMSAVHERDLAAADRRRTIAIAEATLGLRTGHYRAEAGAAATDAMPQGVEVARVLATGVLKSWDESWALEILGGPEAVLDIVPERLGEYEATGADEAYDLTLLRVNGRSPLREVVAASPLPGAAALKFLAACRLLGCLEVVAGAVPRPAASPRTAPRVAAPEPAAPPEADDVETPAAAAPRAGTKTQDDDARAPGAASPQAASARRDEPARSESSVAPARPRPRPLLVALLVMALALALASVAYEGWRQMTDTDAPPSAGAAP